MKKQKLSRGKRQSWLLLPRGSRDTGRVSSSSVPRPGGGHRVGGPAGKVPAGDQWTAVCSVMSGRTQIGTEIPRGPFESIK